MYSKRLDRVFKAIQMTRLIMLLKQELIHIRIRKLLTTLIILNIAVIVLLSQNNYRLKEGTKHNIIKFVLRP